MRCVTVCETSSRDDAVRIRTRDGDTVNEKIQNEMHVKFKNVDSNSTEDL